MPKTKWIMAVFAALLLMGGVFCVWQEESGDVPITAAEGEEASSVFFVWEETAPERKRPEGTDEAEETDSSAVPWIMATEPLMVNINTAEADELVKLPGIGPAKAAAIIAYRTEHGPFSAAEELMKVPGIKEATFAKLKAYVAV